jgi:hypothetical protein
MSLQTPDHIRKLQRKLYLKAKVEPDYRFYLLYDKICALGTQEQVTIRPNSIPFCIWQYSNERCEV